MNELVVNLFAKILPDRETIIEPGQKFKEIYFIWDGIVTIHSKVEERETANNNAFFVLPSKSIFGDFSVLFDI